MSCDLCRGYGGNCPVCSDEPTYCPECKTEMEQWEIGEHKGREWVNYKCPECGEMEINEPYFD